MNRKLWSETRAIAARHDPADREDLAQDLAVRALERMETPRNAAAWLERVGRNAAIDRWRVETRRRDLLVRDEAPACPADPESALLGRERRRLVRSAIASLPRAQRRAALARFHAELSYDDAADRLGTPAATARTRVHRALATLRARLAGLRAMFVFPGVQTAALGLVFVAAQTPARPRPDVIAICDGPVLPLARTHHVAAARVMAAAPGTPPPRPVSPKPARDAQPAPVQTLTFENDEVEGTLRRPDTDFIQGSPRVQHSSLIELRREFVPELLKTLEDL